MQTGVLGAVLAGGRSRRMGRDKASMNFLGRPLATHAAEILGRVFPEVVMVGGPGPGEADLEVELVRDIHPGCGPLGGLHAALQQAAGRPVFVLACDLPLVPAALVRHVVTQAGPESGKEAGRPRATVVSLDGRLQPLCGLYAASCVDVAERHLRQGVLGVHEFFEALEGTSVPLTAELPFFHRQLLLNVNRPADLEAARSRLAVLSEER